MPDEPTRSSRSVVTDRTSFVSDDSMGAENRSQSGGGDTFRLPLKSIEAAVIRQNLLMTSR
jgi:hypothetical protein